MVPPIDDVNEYAEIASLPASGKKVVGSLDIEDCRTLTITCKGKTNASATKGVRVNLYYSPTGEREDWDTVPYRTFDLDLSAGNSTQETINVDSPEIGGIKVEIENLDSIYAATSIQTWAIIKRWDVFSID